ncbi:hypothetical protein MASR2M79_04820 [Aminivibrio sp.]
MKDRLRRTFFVGNCDILVDVDYLAALEFHQQNSYAFTIIGALKMSLRRHSSQGGRLRRVEEKPDVPLIVNTGVYIFEQSCIDLIESGKKWICPI